VQSLLQSWLAAERIPFQQSDHPMPHHETGTKADHRSCGAFAGKWGKLRLDFQVVVMPMLVLVRLLAFVRTLRVDFYILIFI